MRLTTPPVLNEHLPSLDHLNVMVFGQWLLRIKVEKRTNPSENPLNVLSVRLKLIRAYAIVNLF